MLSVNGLWLRGLRGIHLEDWKRKETTVKDLNMCFEVKVLWFRLRCFP